MYAVPASYLDEHRTDRLIIRPLTAAHRIPWMAFLADESATRYYPAVFREEPEAQSHVWIARQHARYANGLFGLLALHLADGTFVGQCGLLTQEIDGEQVLEIGYNVFPEYWGKGYATEAATYFKAYAFQHKIAPFIISNIHIENTPSQAVALRNGMQPWKTTEWNGFPMMVYRILAEED